MEFKCANTNCGNVVEFDSGINISLRCNKCNSGEVVFKSQAVRTCSVCLHKEIVLPGSVAQGRHDCHGRTYIWNVAECKASPDLPIAAGKSSNTDDKGAAKDSGIDKFPKQKDIKRSTRFGRVRP